MRPARCGATTSATSAVGAHGDLAVLDAEHEADVVAHLGGRRGAATVIGGRPAVADQAARGEQGLDRAVDVEVVALLALRAQRVGAAEEVDELAGGGLQERLAVGRGEADEDDLGAGAPRRPDPDVAVAAGPVHAEGEQLAGEHPGHALALTGAEGGVHGVGIAES